MPIWPRSQWAEARLQPGYSVSIISSVQQSARHTGSREDDGDRHKHSAQFCTQRCLLGLQQGVQRIKQQLDENLDRECTPMGACEASGAPLRSSAPRMGIRLSAKGLHPIFGME
ncbi:hypothetical protein BDV23DRAFT_36146 [Aspergillus alliaceus]|uniref:Uncharacterized protein n=1 Tax=Petromyces alliaceus TaxID=209559 RepID=A0A5N7BRL7_PETAA|nr:hypothetical protein BDV23DRAFT_36146 [Aspergillus alliaceus]